MLETLIHLIFSFIGVLRRIWQRLTRRPVPIPVRVRYTRPILPPIYPPISTVLADLRVQADETRHPSRR